ncbi:MAG TPA: acyltransferase [Devosiaceae bacterium]|jgi:acetyltransferase-like isoleucine patch superfamily enzyme|nr:acyltransferase [Devosiaceae bacterium]
MSTESELKRPTSTETQARTPASGDTQDVARIVKSVHGRKRVIEDPTFELGLSDWLADNYGTAALIELYGRFATGDGAMDALMRRAIWKAGARRCGPGLQISSNVGFKHLETFVIGQGVFIGAGAYIQGRFDGSCSIGNNVWIGPQAYFDARNLVLGDHVGWGPSAKVLGSEHTGQPVSVPIVGTDLEIRPVRVDRWADIGTNAVILPGVHIGQGAIVGAGAVVVNDVDPFSIVAGVPARFVRWRPHTEHLRAAILQGGSP